MKKQQMIDWVYKKICSSRSKFVEKFAFLSYLLVYEFEVSIPSVRFKDYPEINILRKMSWDDLAKIYEGIDEESLKTLRRLYEISRMDDQDKTKDLTWKKVLTKAEKKHYVKAINEMFKLTRKSGALLGVESAYHHHGLRELKNAKPYTLNKLFIDAGAFSGDSLIVFLENYHPAKVCSFEPSKINAEIYKKTIEQNHIADDKYELVLKGLSNHSGFVYFTDQGNAGNDLTVDGDERVEVITLDEFCLEKKIPVGFIKADVEGMGKRVLIGAEKTIKKDRPIISLAIYHNEEEFLGIYPLLKSWDLNYHFEIKLLNLPCSLGECTLIGIPNEIYSKD